MIQPTFSAVASATRHAPRVMKKAIDLRRPLTDMAAFYQERGIDAGAMEIGERRKRKIYHSSFAISHLSLADSSWKYKQQRGFEIGRALMKWADEVSTACGSGWVPTLPISAITAPTRYRVVVLTSMPDLSFTR
jgi:hypothetical protein